MINSNMFMISCIIEGIVIVLLLYVINKLIKYKNLPKSIDLLVIKININNELINSKPCYHCIKFIIRKHREINIKNIYFSNENGEIEELNISKININEMYVSSGMRKKYITNT